jgi:hypothetical protein
MVAQLAKLLLWKAFKDPWVMSKVKSSQDGNSLQNCPKFPSSELLEKCVIKSNSNVWQNGKITSSSKKVKISFQNQSLFRKTTGLLNSDLKI